MQTVFDVRFKAADLLPILKKGKVVKAVGKQNLGREAVRLEYLRGVMCIGVLGAEYHLSAEGMANCVVLLPLSVWKSLRSVPPSGEEQHWVYDGTVLKVGNLRARVQLA